LGMVTLANVLTQTLAPKGFVNPTTLKEAKVPGFSTTTALNLFTPLENVIDQKNLLIQQQTIEGFQKRSQETLDDRLPGYAKALRRLNDNDTPQRDLKKRAQEILEELNAKFQPDDDGEIFVNKNTSVDARPTETEIFGNTLDGYTSGSGLTFMNAPRIGVTPNDTMSTDDLLLETLAGTPEKVLVRLDNAHRDSSEDGDNALKAPAGHLDLNGTTLAANTAHELTYAEYQQLNYVSGGKGEIDYLSVIAYDETNGTRGDMVTTALTSNEFPEHRILHDQKVYEFDFTTERDVYFGRFTIEFEGTFANGSFMDDKDAGDIVISMNEYGAPSNDAFIDTAVTSGNTVVGSFGSNLARDGVTIEVKINNFPAVDITDLRITFG